MSQFRQVHADDLEGGGVLIGRYIRGSSDVVVDEITTPLLPDSRTRFSFERAHAPHQQIIEQAWETSNHTCTYLGEWHTHPEEIPEPSSRDRANWLRKLERDRFGESLFFLIVGTDRIRAWEGVPGRPLRELSRKKRNGTVE